MTSFLNHSYDTEGGLSGTVVSLKRYSDVDVKKHIFLNMYFIHFNLNTVWQLRSATLMDVIREISANAVSNRYEQAPRANEPLMVSGRI